ncbi:MAG: hypothetical protein IPM37_04520 [Hahellaceae bacterium]|nr:hypothetical protein [Hahellaceae bacterium]
MRGKVSLIARLAVMAGLSVSMSACFYGAAAVVTGEAVRERARDKVAYVESVDQRYLRYLDDMKTTDCRPEEYDISDKLYDYVRSRPPYGVNEAIKKLTKMYEDKTQSDTVRAEAAYHIAVVYSRRKEPNRVIAESYLNILKDEFPGTHDCVADYLLKEIADYRAAQLKLTVPVVDDEESE